MYSVIKINNPHAVIVSFSSKDDANGHANILNVHNRDQYKVIPSEVTLFFPVTNGNHIVNNVRGDFFCPCCGSLGAIANDSIGIDMVVCIEHCKKSTNKAFEEGNESEQHAAINRWLSQSNK
jgi:hypothetical protein